MNISDRDHHYTPMHWVAAKNHKDVVPVLLKYHANPNLPDRDGMTPLHTACRVGNHAVIEELVSHIEVQVNLGDNYGVRPIHVAVRRGFSPTPPLSFLVASTILIASLSC